MKTTWNMLNISDNRDYLIDILIDGGMSYDEAFPVAQRVARAMYRKDHHANLYNDTRCAEDVARLVFLAADTAGADVILSMLGFRAEDHGDFYHLVDL